MDERMEAVERWAKYVLEHDDMEWSKHQAVLIDSQIESAQMINLSKEQVDSLKGIKRKR